MDAVKYIDLDDVDEHETFSWLPIPWEWWEHFSPPPTTHYWMDLHIDSLYDVFRVRPDVTPVSLPVLLEMRRLHTHIEKWVRDTREEVALTEEEVEEALAAARAAKLERVTRGIKRGREAEP